MLLIFLPEWLGRMVVKWDSNPHGRSHMLLRHARLPFRHSPDASMLLASAPPLWTPAFAGVTGLWIGNDDEVGGNDGGRTPLRPYGPPHPNPLPRRGEGTLRSQGMAGCGTRG